MSVSRRFSRAALCAAFIATLSCAQTWTQSTPTASPSARRSAAMAYDPNLGKCLLYGGLATGPTTILGDVWAFDGATWAAVPSATTPPPRWGHRVVHDTHRNRLVTFGGRSPTITANANDTWEWDGVNWQQVFPTVSPSARAFYSMAFDERRGRTVIFGAQIPTTGGQTWEYDGTTWTQVITPTAILGRETPAMAYDRGRGVIVLFGGWYAASPATMYNDTWEYDGVDWRQVITPTAPTARYRAAFDYDDSRGRLVLYGGFGNATALTDTWEFDGTTWTQTASTGPVKSTECMMAFDPTLNEHVHFGGSGPTGTSAETWRYTGAYTALFNPFGKGCIGTGGTPAIQAISLPILGQTFALNVVNLPPAAAFTTLIVGFDNQNGPFGPLPFDLGVFGLTGCRLETNLDLLLPLPAVGGAATISVGLPLDPLLAGAVFFTQAYTDDVLCPNGIGTTSAAGRGVIGF